MQTDKIDIVTELNKLIEINNDRVAGYETAVTETNEADLKSLFTRFASQSRKFNSDLMPHVKNAGGEPETGTKTSGKFYRAWMEIKSALSGKDRKSILNSCEFGEDVARDTYKEVLKDPSLPASLHSIVSSQFNEISKSHDEIRDLRNSL